VRVLPRQFDTSVDVLGGIVKIVTYGRPDDYYETLSGRYSALTSAEIDAKAVEALEGGDLVFVVVGDADVVRPQLETLGLPIEVREAETSPSE